VKDQHAGANGELSRRWEQIERKLVWARPDAELADHGQSPNDPDDCQS